MPSDRRWLSGLIAFHLVAITLAAFPLPSELIPVEPSTPPPASVLASAAGPVFDSLASAVNALEPPLYRASTPLRIITQPYINAGLSQKWNMFANPNHEDSYMRVDYVIATSGTGRPAQRVQELVFPAAREDQPRWRHQFRDKAVFSSVENYFVRLSGETDLREALESAPDMLPIARYFGRLFRSTLGPGEQLVRVEVWYGVAPTPPPGVAPDRAAYAARLQALEKYRAPLTRRPAAGASLRPGAEVREGDIKWALVFTGEV